MTPPLFWGVGFPLWPPMQEMHTAALRKGGLDKSVQQMADGVWREEIYSFVHSNSDVLLSFSSWGPSLQF